MALNLIVHSTAIQYRFFGLVYDSPQRPQIDAAVKVCIDFEAAVPASENLASPLTYVMAVRTGKRTVGRVYNNYLHTRKVGFVLDKPAQLPKGPSAQLPSEAFVPSPLRGGADMGQLFDGDPFSLRFGPCHNRLADGVIDEGSSRSFSARKPFHQPPAIPSAGTAGTCSCAFALNRTPYSCSFIPVGIYPFSLVCDMIGSDGNIVDAPGPEAVADHAASDTLFHHLPFSLRDICRLIQVKLPFPEDKVRFPLDIGEPRRVKAMIRDADPAGGGPDGDAVACPIYIAHIAEYPGVICDGTQRAKPDLGQLVFGRLSGLFDSLVRFISIGNLAHAADRDLGRKPGRGPGLVITKVMKPDLIKAFGLPCYGAYAVAKGIGLLHGLKQLVGLFGIRAQLYFQDQFHRLLSFQLITLIGGGTAVYAVTGAPELSSAAMIADASAMYLRGEKYFGRFFGLLYAYLYHQTPVRDRT